MLAIFNSLGGGEVIAILVIGLIVLGPEKLPDAIRKFGNIYGELRRMSQGFQSELRDAFDEPMQSIRGTAQMMQDAVNEPLESVTRMAPIVGGGQQAEPADGPEPPEETQPPEEAQVPVDDTPAAGQPAPKLDTATDDEAPAGSAAATWMGEQANGTSAPAAAATEQTNGTEPRAGSPSDGDEPTLAEAGLLVSEPEMPSDELEDEERPA